MTTITPHDGGTPAYPTHNSARRPQRLASKIAPVKLYRDSSMEDQHHVVRDPARGEGMEGT